MLLMCIITCKYLNNTYHCLIDLHNLTNYYVFDLLIFFCCTDLDALSCPSAFEEIRDEDAIQIIVPPNLPDTTFTLRDYVDKSETLTNLVHLGMFFLLFMLIFYE